MAGKESDWLVDSSSKVCRSSEEELSPASSAAAEAMGGGAVVGWTTRSFVMGLVSLKTENLSRRKNSSASESNASTFNFSVAGISN